MTTFKLLIGILFVTVSLFGQESETHLKVLCYNLRFGELASLEELGKFIQSENPDVVMLQEVDVYTHREMAPKQNGKNFIAELGFYTNMMSAYGKAIDYKGGYYGVGLLSKYPIASMERYFLPMVEKGREQRILLVARIDLDSSKQITIASTHLDLKPEIRPIQVASINKILMKETNPILLAGDFNAKPDSPEIKEGMKSWKNTAKDTDFTIPSGNAKSKIDYIFCYPASAWKEVSSNVPQVTLSDHYPITSELILLK